MASPHAVVLIAHTRRGDDARFFEETFRAAPGGFCVELLESWHDALDAKSGSHPHAPTSFYRLSRLPVSDEDDKAHRYPELEEQQLLSAAARGDFALLKRVLLASSSTDVEPTDGNL